MKKRTLSLVLCLCLLLCLLPTAFAEDGDYCTRCEKSEYLSPCYFVCKPSDFDYGHHWYYMCTNHPGGSFLTTGQTLYPHTFENGKCKECGHKCLHKFENSKCTWCDAECTEHQWSWKIENGEYWEECSVCGLEKAKSALPELTLNAPDKVCRTQDYVLSFTLPEGCTDPGFSYEFELKGDGMELTPVDGVCTATIKAEWYSESEGSFKITANATTSDGVTFSVSKTVTIVDGHEGGTATCNEKAVCDICGESYGEFDKDNHVGDTVLIGDKPATCTKDGYTGDIVCTSCNAVLEEGKVLPAEGHKGGTATTTERAVCEICNEPYGELLPAPEPTPAPATTDAPASDDVPQTGDDSAVTLWLALLLISGGAMAVTVRSAKKSK